MENRQRLFIYDRKEIVVLLLLGLLVAVFAFTLGLHLGKRVGPRPLSADDPSANVLVEMVPDQTPHPRELQERAQDHGATQAADEVLNQALHDEVVRTGIKLEGARQVNLPEKTRREGAEAGPARPRPRAEDSFHSSERASSQANSRTAARESSQDILIGDLEALRRLSPSGEYTLEVGSPRSAQDARDHVEALEALGMKPFLRTTREPGKGTGYHIYLGGFTSKEAAELAGEKYRGRHMIDSFEVRKMPSSARPSGSPLGSHAE